MLVWEEDMVKALRKERESLREENDRLRTAAMNLAKEVDDMRLWDSLNSFQLNRFSKYLDLLLVAAKGGIPIYPVAPCPGCTPLCDALKAEVKRLEGLIRDKR